MEFRCSILLLYFGAYFTNYAGCKPLQDGGRTSMINMNGSRDAIDDFTQLYWMPVRVAQHEDIRLAYKLQSPPVRADISDPVKRNPLVTQSDWIEDLKDRATYLIMDEEQIVDVHKAPISGYLANPSLKAIQSSMENIFTLPRSGESHPDNKNLVGSYILQKFIRQGLMTAEQTFHHEIKLNALARMKRLPRVSNVEMSGTNVIGVWPGSNWLTLSDRPLVIGAHWDVVANTTGFNDNGSGVAVMLELARVLTSSDCFRPHHTIVFVAFDTEEAGSVGSYEFVRRLVVPFFANRNLEMSGAIILDTLINYDPKPGKQTIKKEWEKSMPKFAKEVLENENRGDFIATIRRGHPEEELITKLLLKNMDLVKGNAPSRMRFQDCHLEGLPHDRFPTMDELFNYNTFWRSDHSRFWYYREQQSPSQINPALSQTTVFPAVLLTDTALFRGYMRDCYHRSCDNFDRDTIGEVNYQSLTKITEALALTVYDLTVGGESQCKFDFSHRVEEVPEETDSVVANEVSDAEIGSAASAEQFYDSLLAAIDRLEESNYVEEESCYMKGGDCSDKATAVIQKLSSYMKHSSAPSRSQNVVEQPSITPENPAKVLFNNAGSGTQINVGAINVGPSGPSGDFTSGGYLSLDTIANLVRHATGTNAPQGHHYLQDTAAGRHPPPNSPMMIRVGV